MAYKVGGRFVDRPRVQNFFNKFDLYPVGVMQMNFEGKKSVYSIVGLICSAFVYLFMTYFFTQLVIRLVYGMNPNLSTIYELDVHTVEEGALDLVESNFFYAFGVRDYIKDEYKDSSEYIDIHVKVIEGDGDTSTDLHNIKTRTCNDQDWKKFKSPALKDKSRFEKLKERKVMRCLEDTDDKGNKINQKIFGPDDARKHRRVDIIY